MSCSSKPPLKASMDELKSYRLFITPGHNRYTTTNDWHNRLPACKGLQADGLEGQGREFLDVGLREAIEKGLSSCSRCVVKRELGTRGQALLALFGLGLYYAAEESLLEAERMGAESKSGWQQKFKERILELLIGGLLIGTLVTTARYIPTVPKQIEDIKRESVYALQKQEATFSNARAYTNLTGEAVSTRCGTRTKALATLDYWKEHLPADEKTRNDIHIKSANARLEAGDDLGKFNSYSPATTGLPEAYHKAATGVLEAEIKLWESLDNQADTIQRHGRKSVETEDAMKSFVTQFIAFNSAFSAFMSSYAQLPAVNEAAGLERKHIVQSSLAAIDDVQRWYNLARVGFWGSIMGILVVSLFAFRKRKSTSKKSESKKDGGEAPRTVVTVFQYGSNCSPARLNSADRLSGQATPIGIAETIEDYQLAFDVWSNMNNCAAADIVKRPGKKVWGVLYEIPDDFVRGPKQDGKRTLAQVEGKRYKMTTIRVRDREGHEKEAITFVVRERHRRTDIATSMDYVTWIIKGLRENGISEDYIREVKQIASENNPAIRNNIEQL